MAFVDLSRDTLVLKVLLAGPPASGKSERLTELGARGEGVRTFGSRLLAETTYTVVQLDSVSTRRAVELEIYEWHGPEKVDIRARSLFTGLDGLIYLADARADRLVDTQGTLAFLRETSGRTRLARIPALLVRARGDEGLLGLDALERKLDGVSWSLRFDGPLGDPGFPDAVLLLGEAMLARVP
jgi:hypothetical protein